MTHSVAMTSEINKKALQHLIREDGQEDLCFALWNPSQGAERKTALIAELLLPEEDERSVHANADFFPNYFERALSIARSKHMGLAFMHSHPYPGWQGMSGADIKAERENAPAVKAATGLPFVGLTVGTDGAWSARFWEKIGPSNYRREWCGNVRVIGDGGLEITSADSIVPVPRFREQLTRTVSAWGEKSQAKLARTTFGVVGTGSVGSVVAESLARMGVQKIILIDFDAVEKINLDRLLHATEADIGRPKVKVATKALRKNATAEKFSAEEVLYSVVEESGFRKTLDCDVIFSCVDRPLPRSILNLIAYAHLIPVIDGGISIQTTTQGTLQGADWKAHVACYGRRCLECLGQYDPTEVQSDREGKLDDPTYINSLARDHALRRNENVFSFSASLASMQVLQMLSLLLAPMRISNLGEYSYHFVTGNLDIEKKLACQEHCIYQTSVATGDNCSYKVTGRHERAETIRKSYRQQNWWSPFIKFYRKFAGGHEDEKSKADPL
jgi:hypothetical protein